MKGVINLRGKVIPVVDLRLRFGLEQIDYTERTCIIVVEIEGQNGTIQMGIVVDSVSEVLNIKGEEIEKAPSFGTELNTNYILGMAFSRLTKQCRDYGTPLLMGHRLHPFFHINNRPIVRLSRDSAEPNTLSFPGRFK